MFSHAPLSLPRVGMTDSAVSSRSNNSSLVYINYIFAHLTRSSTMATNKPTGDSPSANDSPKYHQDDDHSEDEKEEIEEEEEEEEIREVIARGNTAVIYLPSIAPMDQEEELEMRIAFKMNTPLKRYKSVLRGHIHYGHEDKYKANRHTLVEYTRPGGEYNTSASFTPKIDFFWFEYHENLNASWYRKSVLYKVFWMLLAVGFSIWHMLRLTFNFLTCFYCDSSRRLHYLTAMQVINFMLLVFLLSLAYFAILVWAFIVSILGLVQKSLDLRGYSEKIVVWLTFLDYTIIPFFLEDYRMQIRNAAVLCLGIGRYIVGAPIEKTLQAQLRSLLVKLHEENYDEIQLVSYSFGTLLAYDALFPRTKELQLDSQDLYSKVNKLITVGFPYGLINVFLPKYYANRGRNLADGVDISWLNVFLKTDVFATEFLLASHEPLQVTPNDEERVEGPNTSCPVLDTMLGGGYLAHTYYFSEDSYAAGDACDKIAAALRPTEPAV